MDRTNSGPLRKHQLLKDHKLDIYKKIIRELIASSELDDDADAESASIGHRTSAEQGPE